MSLAGGFGDLMELDGYVGGCWCRGGLGAKNGWMCGGVAIERGGMGWEGASWGIVRSHSRGERLLDDRKSALNPERSSLPPVITHHSALVFWNRRSALSHCTSKASLLITLSPPCPVLIFPLLMNAGGPDEVRAWTIRQGLKAPQAAGVIQ